MHSFSYVRGFSLEGFFTRLRVLTRHPRILFFSFSPVFLCIFPYEGKCQNKVASGDEEASGDKEASGDEEASGHD